MRFIRSYSTLLVVLSAAGSATVVLTVPSGAPERIVAGVVLVLVAPWAAAGRLAVVHRGQLDESRLAVSGGLYLAAVVLVGLGLSATSVGLTTSDATAGAVVITLMFSAGNFGAAESKVSRLGLSTLGVLSILIAAGLAIMAIVVARHGALSQARREYVGAAFLIRRGRNLDVGLENAGSSAVKSAVLVIERGERRHAMVTIPADGVKIIPGLIHSKYISGPALSKVNGLAPFKIYVSTQIDGRKRRQGLELSSDPLR